MEQATIAARREPVFPVSIPNPRGRLLNFGPPGQFFPVPENAERPVRPSTHWPHHRDSEMSHPQSTFFLNPPVNSVVMR